MTDLDHIVSDHYGRADLHKIILSRLLESGVAAADLTHEHLTPVDEFHIGGVAATEHLLDPLGIEKDTFVLDIGSGIGGTARLLNRRYGARVTGIDLTPEYVRCAQELTSAVGLEAEFREGNAVDLPFEDSTFEVVTLLHVGMNIRDKPALFRGASRVLKLGGRFAVYDVMLFGAHPAFPLPWAATPEASFLTRPADYLAAAEAAGLKLIRREDRGAVAVEFFDKLQVTLAASDPPPVGLQILMGDTAAIKVGNMMAAAKAGDIEPVEMVFEKAA